MQSPSTSFGEPTIVNRTIVSPAQWREARIQLLEEEKALTRRSDELARKRAALPWVKVDKPYRFETESGDSSLAEMFRGRSQLIVYHFMFGPDYEVGCPSCSSLADGFDGAYRHLQNHDVMFWAVSRAPLTKLLAYRKRMGWSFPWASSHDSDFNNDFDVQITKEQQRSGEFEYNYRREPLFAILPDNPAGPPDVESQIAATCGTDAATFLRDRPGMSAFALQDGQVYHTYSAYARGLDAMWSMYQWLDRAPLGRNESSYWIRRHDEYEAAPSGSKCCSH
jgi:predicted dithiol-disulfide oxidoreductase (DUF899 family)